MTVSIYTKTARKAKDGKVFAFGRVKALDGQPVEKGGYLIFRLCENYDGKVRGGIRKTWRYTDDNLSYDAAIRLMNRKLGREEFSPVK